MGPLFNTNSLGLGMDTMGLRTGFPAKFCRKSVTEMIPIPASINWAFFSFINRTSVKEKKAVLYVISLTLFAVYCHGYMNMQIYARQCHSCQRTMELARLVTINRIWPESHSRIRCSYVYLQFINL